MEKIILGIDPGTLIMGYSLLEVDDELRQPRLLTMDVVYLKKIADPKLRLRRIYDSTLRIIDTFHPDHLGIEAPFFGKNFQSALKLGRAQGIAIAAAMARDLSFTEYEPATVKQNVTGNGNASKEQVAQMIRSIFQFDNDPRYFDATDALAIAYSCFLDLYNPLADIRSELLPTKKRGKSRRQSWTEFVEQNPDRQA
ncbi:MAG: crossover junction endodeoxyribonuclease RuvC [Bacteroidales bacterium]|nr:crossover junction endodeoxyribonuclease RuvC [Bacteroidales bacterium]